MLPINQQQSALYGPGPSGILKNPQGGAGSKFY